MDIIYISSIDWRFSWHRQQEMMYKLSQSGTRVLFVQPNKKEIRVSSVLKKCCENIWLLSCRGGPYERCFRSMNYINMKLSRKDITDAMEQLGFDKPVIWMDRVHGFDYNFFSSFITVYDLVDEILAFGRMKNSKMLIQLENYVLKNVNLLISSSNTLMKRKIKQSGRCGESIFIPNGVDIGRFQHYVDKPQKNIIGFVGQISERSLNTEIIHYVAKKHPEWKFVFTGPGTAEDRKKLCNGMPNITTQEAVPGDKIPEVINEYDVCVIPYFHDNLSMDYVFPRKACEYLASGRPVVSTDLSEIHELQPHVIVADTPEEFEKAISYALKDENVQEKMEFARRFDWNVLIPILINKLNEIK